MDPFQTITLVIKAPDQRIEDQTVECVAGWTVQKLKNHLSNVYPSKPAEKDQKIIYSGKLLHDHLMLRDILRQYEDTVAHTLHLVCATVPLAHMDSGNVSRTETQSVNEDGSTLRHRNISNTQNNLPYQHPYGNIAFHMAQFQQQQAPQPPQMQYSNMYMTPYQQQQAMWMQQMYTQQQMAAQYMQYMSQGGMVPNMESTPVPEDLPINQNIVAPPQAPVIENQVNNQPANQNVRMNAGVGPPMDDDEEEFNRDWLDWVYMLSRFSLLLSIVYFYSSIDRFLLVMGFVAIMYLYQRGWFRVRRRQNRRVAAVVPPPPPPQEVPRPSPENPVVPDEGQPQDEPGNDTNIDTNNDSNASTEQDGQNTENSNNENEAERPEPQPSVLETAWNFVSTFFISLMPQGPPEFPN